MAQDAELMKKLNSIQQVKKNLAFYEAQVASGREGYTPSGLEAFQASFQNGTFLESCSCSH
jgi:hypothetical protein